MQEGMENNLAIKTAIEKALKETKNDAAMKVAIKITLKQSLALYHIGSGVRHTQNCTNQMEANGLCTQVTDSYIIKS